MKCEKEFDTVKQELINIEELTAIKNNPVVKATILSVLNSIPIIGKLIDSSMDTLLTHFQKEKRNELLNCILSDRKITSDQVNDVEFIINLAKTLEVVNKLATNDKVKYFANLLKNSYFIDDKTTCDEFDENIDILSRLSYREIKYLLFLYEYQNKNYGNENPYFKKFGKEFGEGFKLKEFDYQDIFQKLTHTGFIQTLYKTNKAEISRNEVINEYDEEFTMADIEVDIDWFWVTDIFITFAKRIGESYE